MRLEERSFVYEDVTMSEMTALEEHHKQELP